jgi:hypothetical protein
MVDKDFDRLIAAQPAHIADTHDPVAIQIEPEAPHGVDGHTVLGRPARIIGIIDEPAFPIDDLFGNLSHRLHGHPLSRHAGKVAT